MRRIKLTVEFDGTLFAGLQIQGQGERTVQSELEAALAQIPGTVPKVVACGRTDTGVHALAMPVHYDTEDSIPAARIPFALNSLLPPDLRALSAEEVDPEFHARKSCFWREYRYRILQRTIPPALERSRVWWIPHALNLVPMRHALESLVGLHDFGAFAVKEEHTTVREVYRAHLEVRPADSGREVWLEFTGSGFVRGQVRSMVGTLVEVGLGKRDSSSVAALLEGGSRSQAGPTAPPQGLYFVQAGYEPYGKR
jgi:tRNA pseudouridine38-40 synthase